MSKKFKDTLRLSPAAQAYELQGRYTLHPPNTPAYFDFWDEERRRCLEGYTTPEGDITITGYHYFYLNYCRMQTAQITKKKDGTELAERKTTFPRFYDSDHDYFHSVDKCRVEGLHLTVLKARRKGYSYKAASMMNRNYFLVKHSKNFVFAGQKAFLTGVDGILQKAFEIMNFVDAQTAWTQPRLKDGPMEKTSGYRVKVKGQFVEKGMLSSIAGDTLKDDPDKARGKAGELVFFEEAGAFSELLAAWSVALPTMRQGNRTLGTMIAFGTGGTEGDGFESLNELFYNPDSYECLSFENTWSQSNYGAKCGYFVPIYDILEGFIDENGNSLRDEAKQFESEQREKRRKGNDPKTYDRYMAEHPFEPEEATLQVSGNLFNISLLKEQSDRVRSNGLHTSMGIPIRVSQSEKGFTYTPDWDLRPVHQFPHRKGEHIDGCVVMYERPFKKGDLVPDNLYFICHDPYAHEKSTTDSLGAAYVIKRPNNMSQPDDMIVASYVGRPSSQDEYNRNLFALAGLYNARIGFENDRGDIIGYAKRYKQLHRLQPEFEFLQNRELQSSRVNRGYGMHMTETRKRQGEIYLRDWLESQRGRKLDDSYTCNVHKIYDLALLEELKRFNHKGNFDRCMALIVGMFMMQEMFNTEVKPKQRTAHGEWFDSIYSGNPIFADGPETDGISII